MDLVIFLPLIIIHGRVHVLRVAPSEESDAGHHRPARFAEVGDRVHTTSGMQATITGINDDTVDLEIAPGVVTTWMKLAVRDRIVDDTDEDDVDDDEGTDLDYEAQNRPPPRSPKPEQQD